MKLCNKHAEWTGMGCPCCNAVVRMEAKNDLLRRALKLIGPMPWDQPDAWQLLSDINVELARRLG